MTAVVSAGLLAAAVITVVINGIEAVGKIARAGFVMKNSTRVGVDPRWLPHLAVLEGAGTVGVALGIAGVPVVGTAAAIGLVLFFVGAVVVHLRSRVYRTIGFPAGFLVLAGLTVGYFATA